MQCYAFPYPNKTVVSIIYILPEMFQIDANNLPFVQTRQALLLLDLQNDFLAPDAALRVTTPLDFVENIVKLAPEFRSSGNLIWIRTNFEASRKINEPHADSESVITNAQLNQAEPGGSSSKPPGGKGKELQSHGQAAKSSSVLASDEDDDDTAETYLTLEPDEEPQVVLAMSPGTNLAEIAIRVFDFKKDLFMQKSYYSAFRDGTLLQILRAKFVTEIYICGALTNIDVFATAMDAARHGYGITIIEDCLGYRSKARHNEALRRLVEFTGCEVVTSEELVKDLRESAKKADVPVTGPVTGKRPPPPSSRTSARTSDKSLGLEGLMSGLSLRSDRSPTSNSSVSGSQTLKVTESPGDSHRTEDDDPDGPLRPTNPTEGDGKKRERVKTKVKSRRRLSNASKTTASGSSDKGPASSTSAPLRAPPAVEKMPNPVAATAASASSLVKPSRTSGSNPKLETEMDRPIISSDAISIHAKDAVEEHESVSDDEKSVLCEGDTQIIKNLLDEDLAQSAFATIRDEVRWQKMSHQGGEVPRLVAVQGEVAKDGTMPVYRHPADESPPLLPFSTTISLVRTQVEKHLGHPVNHVLIQFYRDGTDYISEHTDKTLDIRPETFIANVSLGAQRTMVFRTKRQKTNDAVTAQVAEPRKTCRALLPHNSMCKMGLATNMRWLHGIRQDKRLPSEKMAEDLAYQGGRISLTFRQIGTFLDKDQQKIWGQGATAKTKDEARIVINGSTPEAEKMLRAFGKENQSTEFNWKAAYGEGFDVLHISNTPKLFLSGDSTADLSVKLYLAEHSIEYEEGIFSPPFTWKDGSAFKDVPDIPEALPIKFIDNDHSRSTIVGDLAIMLYISSVYGPSSSIPPPTSPVDLARQFTRLQQSSELLRKWRARPFHVKPFQKEFKLWEGYALEAPYMGGERPTLADFALFPIIEEIKSEWENAEGFLHLATWYLRMRLREAVMRVMGPLDKFTLERKKELEAMPTMTRWD
ncbi:hypothetical protein LZ554_000822 [Drepanopeziza brunnea f. sp. 'monogermtubi']|nr:hypothetical protein LZ554_000822 [Drepanopeziza brunnea f. sp. 'monogermtubi']